MNNPPESQMLMQEVLSAQESAKNSLNQMNTFLKEARGYNKDMFFQLAILSGATLSLSVTFVGYLVNKDITIQYPCLLFTGWFLCVLAMTCGILRTRFYTSFGHWQVQGSYAGARKKMIEAELKMYAKFPAEFLTTQGIDPKVSADNLKENLSILQGSIEFNTSKENFFKFLWYGSEYAAMIGFVGGIVLIVLFAAFNISLA